MVFKPASYSTPGSMPPSISIVVPLMKSAAPLHKMRERLAWTTVVALAGVALALWIFFQHRPSSRTETVRFLIPPPENSYIDAEVDAAVHDHGRCMNNANFHIRAFGGEAPLLFEPAGVRFVDSRLTPIVARAEHIAVIHGPVPGIVPGADDRRKKHGHKNRCESHTRHLIPCVCKDH